MSLLQTIRTGKTQGPPRLLIYGTEGIGKSTFGASAPKPIFIPTEDGLDNIDCASFPLCKTFTEVMSCLEALLNEPHDYQTVVVDTLDWLERLIWDHTCQQYRADNIEKVDGGYGKGYTILPDIFLPDGEYEISVLTSSLFWKDAACQDIRTIVVGADSEISPLPTIYNLRSAVQSGAMIIQWSATKSEVEDCLFAIWYSPESPVDTVRPPDATVWYSSFMTEYQTSFEQNAPAYVAVAALRPGNESEKGKVHELFLDWSSVPPRAPDDVVVLPEPFPVYDPEIVDRALEAEDLALAF